MSVKNHFIYLKHNHARHDAKLHPDQIGLWNHAALGFLKWVPGQEQEVEAEEWRWDQKFSLRSKTDVI